jgi:hypothetical protein
MVGGTPALRRIANLAKNSWTATSAFRGIGMAPMRSPEIRGPKSVKSGLTKSDKERTEA